MTTHPIPDTLTLDAPEQPATMASVLFRLGAALELLPQPIAVHVDNINRHYVQVSGAAEYEAWRQWLGAPEVEPGEWTSYEPIGYTSPPIRHREWKSTVTWRGQTITVVRVEMVPAEQGAGMTTPTATVEQRVAAGAAWLDEHEPGWADRIDVAELDVGMSCSCVLGQLDGDFHDGMQERGLSVARAGQLGFTLTEDESSMNVSDEFDALTAAWRQLIETRRSQT